MRKSPVVRGGGSALGQVCRCGLRQPRTAGRSRQVDKRSGEQRDCGVERAQRAAGEEEQCA
jgi:hypothetical protein